MLSFVIPAHNEQAVIEATLRTLVLSAEAVREPFELIVVGRVVRRPTRAIDSQWSSLEFAPRRFGQTGLSCHRSGSRGHPVPPDG